MLILSFKKGESAIIDHDIKVTVLGEDKHQIKLGFDAPQDVGIWREKLYRRMQAENGGNQ